ncbi:MAG: hypothetical protein WCV73_00045 [Patescibacteria group bacterium]|jgi:hypothetical protein
MVINLNYFKFSLLLLILLAFNILNWPAAVIASLAGALFLIFAGLAIGNWLFIKNSWTCRFIYGLLFTGVFAALINTAFFYLSKMDQNAHLATLVLIFILTTLAVKKHPLIFNLSWKFVWPRLNLTLLTLGYGFFIALMFWLIFKAQTIVSIRSPWETITPQIFLLYFLATFILYAIIKFSHSNKTLFLVCLHAFLSFSVALIIYRLGFDYDPFIHRENLRLIAKNGTLLPKPFYYIGQYGLIIFLSKLLKIGLDNLDKLLLPLMSAVYLPTTVYYAFKDNFKAENKNVILTALTILLLPFGGFILTTPQALANLFSLITILLSLYYINHPRVALWPLALLVIMALVVHPLAGLPLFFFFAVLAFYQHRQKKFPLTGTSNLPKIIHQSILWEIIILGSLALPVAFLINSYTLSQLKVTLSSSWVANIIASLSHQTALFYYRPFISLTDLVYSFGKNSTLIIFVLALTGLFFVVKHRQFKPYFAYLAGFLMLIMNYFLVKGMISFFSLLSYEQITYPKRILEISIYLLLPFIIISLYLFFQKLQQQKSAVILLSFVLLSVGLSCSWYLAYPRVDKISEDHGYSSSQTDFKTVKFIDELQKSQPYIVLAAQPVSAAAISSLGFKYYYNDNFFYPVPTASRLYGLYEDLAYAKGNTGEIIATAGYLTGVTDIYFVLNNYWLNASDLIEKHKQSADQWFAIDGKNYIFKYQIGK